MTRTRDMLRIEMLLLCLSLAGPAHAAPPCPDGSGIDALQLQGPWLVQLHDQPGLWQLDLKPHPEHIGSLRGELNTGAQRFLVVADLDEEEFTLEETHDGQRIAATWLGNLNPASCGQSLNGERHTAQGASQSFEMRRKPVK